ncbi:MAG: hypothetical protein HQK84_01765 [Nitrospinae bacterium]|nr:hypothetical protein [Nitrospinota bacterium]
MKISRLFFLFLLSLAFYGCQKTDVEYAFNNNFEPQKNNRIISEYCVSCHPHKDFDRDGHITGMSLQYNEKKYSDAKECTDCHEYRKDFWTGDEHRSTIRP